MIFWQEWAVALILLACTVRIVLSFLAFFRKSKKKSNPCESCVTGCDLRRLYEENRANCSGKEEKKIRKCCK